MTGTARHPGLPGCAYLPRVGPLPAMRMAHSSPTVIGLPGLSGASLRAPAEYSSLTDGIGIVRGYCRLTSSARPTGHSLSYSWCRLCRALSRLGNLAIGLAGVPGLTVP
jgi:hypothetical protein